MMSEYSLDNRVWSKEVVVMDEFGNEGFKYSSVTIVDVPVKDLLVAWEDLIYELSDKDVKLAELKEVYNGKEFDIVYQSDIDFKALYGSTSEKVRKQHASDVLSELNDEIQGLELSIAWIKQYIPLLREVIRWKTNKKPVILNGGSTFDEESIEQLKKALEGIKNE